MQTNNQTYQQFLTKENDAKYWDLLKKGASKMTDEEWAFCNKYAMALTINEFTAGEQQYAN